MDNRTLPTDRPDLSERLNAPPRSTLTVDVARYEAFLADTDMTDAQKEEFLQALWSIIVSFVELGFGVHPLQEVCGQNAETPAQSAKDGFNEVNSETFIAKEEPEECSP